LLLAKDVPVRRIVTLKDDKEQAVEHTLSVQLWQQPLRSKVILSTLEIGDR
jgi:hypothetical protein